MPTNKDLTFFCETEQSVSRLKINKTVIFESRTFAVPCVFVTRRPNVPETHTKKIELSRN